jgi:hypothetical protein
MKRTLAVIALSAWCGFALAQSSGEKDKTGINRDNAEKTGKGAGELFRGMGQEIGKLNPKDDKKKAPPKPEEKK